MVQNTQGRRITLSSADYDLEIAPQLGGAVTALRWRSRDVLRPAAASAAHAIDAASFSMAPYANRIAFGRFVFDGRQVQLERNRDDQCHPLHGSAWLAPWRVEELGQSRADVSRQFERSDWPWRFSCRQIITLDGEGARFSLSVRNDDDTAMPLSFGFHPFFARAPGAVLRARVSGVWRADKDLLPVALDATTDLPGLAEGALLDAAPFVDHCHAGWDGEVTLSAPGMVVRMNAAPDLGFLHLYLPVRQSYFCAEPVSAIPDAFNQPDPVSVGMRTLEPGETAAAWMHIAASVG